MVSEVLDDPGLFFTRTIDTRISTRISLSNNLDLKDLMSAELF